MTNKIQQNKSPVSTSAMTMLALCLTFGSSAANVYAQESSAAPRLYKYTDNLKDDAWPAMIFETKGKTYFKVAKGNTSPRVTALTSCHTPIEVAQKAIDGYVVVPSMHAAYMLTLNGKQRVASYGGGNKFSEENLAADRAACAHTASLSNGSNLQNARLLQAGSQTSYVTGPSLSRSPAQLTKPAAPKESFSIKISDGTIYNALQRWSKSAGWQLSWEATRDFAVTLEATYIGDYEAAVGQLMTTLERSQYPLHACTFDNRAIRVVHKSKSCEE